MLLKKNLLCATSILAAAMALASPAWAQEEEATEVEGLVITTGSRIERPNLDSAVPVQSIGETKLEGQGYENIADVLTTLPQFAAAFGSSRTQSTFSGTADSGLNTVNLRNLGSERSLVLINGRRAPSGTISDGAVDLNTIPSANIRRIDVITGGASAVYGADAVSGVVNIITDTTFDGLEVGASYGLALENHDNTNPSAFIRWGMNGDRGNVGLTLQYDFQGEVSCADRYLCAEDFAWFHDRTDPEGTAPIRGPAARSGVPLTGRYFVANDATEEGANVTFIDGAMVPFSVAEHGYNRNAQRTLAIPTERIMAAAHGNFNLTDNIRFFGELNYGSSHSEGPFEAHPFQSSSDFVSGLLEPSIPLDNPFIPAPLLALATTVGDTDGAITWWDRFEDLEARGSDNTRQTIRAAFGFEGGMDTLFGFGSDWNWETSYVYGRTTLDGRTLGLVAKDALYAGLRVEPDGAGGYQCDDPLARAQGCIPINPFDGFDAAEQAYLVRSGGLKSASDLQNALAYISGSVFEMPAGPLGFAVGLESRRVTAYEDYSTEINLGTTTGNQISDSVETTFKTDEWFTEVTVPILADMPFVQLLQLEGGYRYSDTNNIGDYETWRYGAVWAPVEGLRFRGMKNRAVRAPVLGEVTGVGETFGQIDDPCVNWGASTDAVLQANCAAEGIPNNYDPPLVVQQNVGGFEGGNPNLGPEIADTLTYGFVAQFGRYGWTPEWMQTLTLSVDRFEIDIEDLINTVGRQNIAQLCYTTEGAGRDVFCSQLTRGSDPAVPGANYVLTDVNDQFLNIASLSIKGVDVELNYNFEPGALFGRGGDWGGLRFNTVWTFYDEATQVPIPGQPAIDLLGAAGGSTSDQGWLEKQGTTTLDWGIGRFNTIWTSRYIGEAISAPPDLFGFDSTVDIDAHWYHDLQVRYGITDAAEVFIGVNNVFDKEPPFFPFSQAGTQALDTIPAYYDVFGRSLYFGAKARF